MIKQCSVEGCETWYVAAPRSRYCDYHKQANYERMKNGWAHAKSNGGVARRSRFSKEEIQEMRWMFLRMPAAEIAEHFNCNRSSVYHYVHNDPVRYREVE